MTTKAGARGTAIDWRKVELVTEVRRTYLIKDRYGHEFYKMYKPSEAQKIFRERGWRGQIVSTLDRSALRRKS